MSSTHAHRGKWLEQQCAAQHKLYALQRRAHVTQRPPGAAWGKDGKLRPGQSGMPDYVGLVAPDGRAVAFDCKQSKTARLPLKINAAHRLRFTRQLGHLEAYSRAGGFGFLLVHLGCAEAGRQSWVVPVRSLTEGWPLEWLAGRRPSLLLADLEDVAIPIRTAGGPMDWLPALEEGWR